MKPLFYKFTIVMLLLFSLQSYSQSFTIDGITGISFNESGSDYSISITNDFTAYGTGVSPQSVTLNYTAATNNFSITGDVTTTVDGNTIDAEITFDITNKVVDQIVFAVSADFVIEGLTFTPNSLTFLWNKTDSRFEIFGDASIEMDSNSIDIDLGNGSSPGFVIKNGVIEKIQAEITADFSLKDMDFEVSAMTLNYSGSDKTFSIFGSGKAQFDGEEMDINLGNQGDPGIVYNSSDVEQIHIEVSASFDMRGLTLEPKNLGFEWKSSDNTFIMFGEVTGTLDGNDISLVLGNPSQPGVVIFGGTINRFTMEVTGEFSAKGITIESSGLTFAYQQANNHFEMFGDANAKFESTNISVSLGNQSSPGFIYKNNVIEEISFGVSGDFSLEGLTMTPDNFSFEYSKSSDRYEMYGVVTSDWEGDSLELDLGDMSNPGILINNGSLQQVDMTITEDFTLKDLEIESDNLTIIYRTGFYEMYGATTVTFDSESIDVTLGDMSNPGLKYENGAIDQINFEVTADFSLKGLSISPQAFGFDWDGTKNYFKMYGTLKSDIEGNEISLILGDNADPGVIIQSGVLETFMMTVNADFNFKNITFSPDDLTFVYNKTGDLFEMFGSLSTSFDGESLDVTMGDSFSPGLKYKSGVVESLNLGVTAEFTMKGISFNPQSFGFDYDKTGDQFKMFGTIKSKIEGNDIDLSLGDASNPGLVIRNGIVEAINMSVTADFEFKHMTFKPSDLTFVYNRSEDKYEMYGDLDVTFDEETLSVTLGDASEPGFEYKNGVVESIDIGVTADFKLKDLEIIPTDLTFIYQKSGSKYEMYGDIKFKVGSDEIEANLGDSSDPGMLFESGKIKHINIGVTTTFKISGLKIKATDVGVDWSSGKYFHLYGDADLSIANDDIDADFGTFSDPGIKINNGKLHSLDVDINSDIKLGNLEVETKSLVVKYSSSKFEVTGEMSIKEVFSLSVTLGSGSQGGLEIDVSGSEPKFKIEDLTIDIEHANLGAIDLKQIKLEFNSDGIKESDVKVVFPEGWEIDSTMKFKDVHGKAELDEISLSYRADNLDDAIEIFEGVQLSYLSGDVKNLTKPSSLEVSGGIGTIYGGGFTLDHKSATFLEMSDNVTISSKEFKIDGDVNVGAYRSGTNSWHSLLGSGSIDLTAYFHHYIKASVNAKYPGDPLIEADLSVYFDSHGHFDGLLDVEFIVPHWVPFIGGKHYGSVDGAVRYKKGDLNGSFGAAWVRIKTFWHTYHEGAKYTFGSRHVSSIGSGSISSIQNTIRHDENSRKVGGESKVFEFEVPQPAPNSMLIDIDWVGEVDKALVTVVGPEGTYELTKAVIAQENAIDETPTMTYEENMTLIEKDTVTTFMFKTPSAFSEEEIIHSNLVDGKYHLIVTFPEAVAEIDTIQFKPKWQIPEANIIANKTVDNKYELSIDYWTALPDSTLVSFYVNNVNSYDEGRLINHTKATNYDVYGNGTESLVYTPKFFEGNTSELYFYAIIEDGVNPPFRSVISSGFNHQHDITGTISLTATGDITKEGLRVFLDIDNDGNFDTASTGGLEPSNISNESGLYSFRDVPIGTYNLRVVLPEGYRLVGETDNFSSKSVTFNGNPVELNLEIEKY